MLVVQDCNPIYFVSIGESDTDPYPPRYHLAHHVLLCYKVSQVLSQVLTNLYLINGISTKIHDKAIKRLAGKDSNMVCDTMLNRILEEHKAYIRVSYPPDEIVDVTPREWRFTVSCATINPELLRLISISISKNNSNIKGYKPEFDQPTLRGESCVPLSKERWFRYTGLSKRVAYVQVFNHLSEFYEEVIGPRKIHKSNIEPMTFLTLIQVCIALRLDISIVDSENNIYPIIYNFKKTL